MSKRNILVYFARSFASNHWFSTKFRLEMKIIFPVCDLGIWDESSFFFVRKKDFLWGLSMLLPIEPKNFFLCQKLRLTRLSHHLSFLIFYYRRNTCMLFQSIKHLNPLRFRQFKRTWRRLYICLPSANHIFVVFISTLNILVSTKIPIITLALL